jgi:hypothetical protein
MAPKLFDASQFTPTQFSTAEEKARFANHFVRFVEKDFPWTLFHKQFYNRLSMTFRHIAHFNQHRFYSVFFRTTADKVRFLRWTLQPVFGDPAYTYVDAEREIHSWLFTTGLLEVYEQRLREETECHERQLLATLKAKYEGEGVR